MEKDSIEGIPVGSKNCRNAKNCREEISYKTSLANILGKIL